MPMMANQEVIYRANNKRVIDRYIYICRDIYIYRLVAQSPVGYITIARTEENHQILHAYSQIEKDKSIRSRYHNTDVFIYTSRSLRMQDPYTPTYSVYSIYNYTYT